MATLEEERNDGKEWAESSPNRSAQQALAQSRVLEKMNASNSTAKEKFNFATG
jgi:hypothetical protein